MAIVGSLNLERWCAFQRDLDRDGIEIAVERCDDNNTIECSMDSHSVSVWDYIVILYVLYIYIQ